MREELLNDFFQIEPIVHDQFVVSGKEVYEEIGNIVAMPKFWEKEHPEWRGGICYFDSYIAKKYPVMGGKIGAFQWFVPLSEIVKIEMPDT